MVLPDTVAVPSLFMIPPPSCLAEFPDMVLPDTVAVPCQFWIPPPYVAELLEILLLDTVNLAAVPPL